MLNEADRIKDSATIVNNLNFGSLIFAYNLSPFVVVITGGISVESLGLNSLKKSSVVSFFASYFKPTGFVTAFKRIIFGGF